MCLAAEIFLEGSTVPSPQVDPHSEGSREPWDALRPEGEVAHVGTVNGS